MNKPFFFQMAVKEVSQEGGDGAVRIRGYASTPQLDRYRDIVEPEAFKGALKQFMTNPIMLRSHDSDRPIGEWVSAEVTEKGLWVEGIVKEKETADDVSNGLFRTLSIGYIPTKTEIRNKDNEPLGEGDSMWDWNNIRVIKELDLVEISVVSTPANPGALFTLAKSLEQFTRQLALKAFGMDAKSNVPDNESESGAADEGTKPAEGEEGVEGAEDETKSSEPEKPTEEVEPEAEKAAPLAEADEDEGAEDEEHQDAPEEEKAGEADEIKDESEGKTTPPEDVENEGEKPSADGGEGGEKPTEEPNADAEPDKGSESGDESEGKELIVSKDVIDALPHFAAAGAVREAKEGEVPTKMDKATIMFLRKLHDALAAENKRANEEQKRADGLQEKLNGLPDKKTLATHRQFGVEEEAENAPARKKQTSEWFKQKFGLK